MSVPSSVSLFDNWLLQRIHQVLGKPPVRIVARSGGEVSPTGTAPVAATFISDHQTLVELCLNPDMGFGDAYAEGRIQVEGDLVALLESVYRSTSIVHSEGWYSKLAAQCLEWSQANTLSGSRRNIHHHYDLSTEFYRLWLDAKMVYTCAYFPSASATLEEAQFAKMEDVCRKLQLQPGERVVDAGCGWGALALHMASHYGVNVRAFNISHEQILFAREQAKKLGVTGQVEFIEDDYRNISGEFDAFVSVGMLEHVGSDHYADVARVIQRSVGDAGRGLLHFIGRNQPRPLSAWTRKRIFPGAYMPALSQVVEMFEPLDFSVLDVENLRFHYAKTLEHWLSRFESCAECVSAMYDPKFVRTWRLYLAGALAGFRVGTLQLFQVVFAGPACQQIPWTRAHVYAPEPPTEQESKWFPVMS